MLLKIFTTVSTVILFFNSIALAAEIKDPQFIIKPEEAKLILPQSYYQELTQNNIWYPRKIKFAITIIDAQPNVIYKFYKPGKEGRIDITDLILKENKLDPAKIKEVSVDGHKGILFPNEGSSGRGRLDIDIKLPISSDLLSEDQNKIMVQVGDISNRVIFGEAAVDILHFNVNCAISSKNNISSSAADNNYGDFEAQIKSNASLLIKSYKEGENKQYDGSGKPVIYDFTCNFLQNGKKDEKRCKLSLNIVPQFIDFNERYTEKDSKYLVISEAFEEGRDNYENALKTMPKKAGPQTM